MDEWFLAQQGYLIYVALFFLLMGGTIGLPIPEDLPLILAGIAIQAERADLKITAAVCYSAILLGDIVIYLLGRVFGFRLFRKRYLRTHFKLSRIKAIRKGLEKQSLFMIFIARHLFYLRTLTFLVCGAVRMDFKRFLIADGAAALISVPLMLALGFFAAEHYNSVITWLDKVKHWSLIFIVVTAVIVWAIWARRSKQPPRDQGTGSSGGIAANMG